MKTRHLPAPVHVHVSETTPVHVHMRKKPSQVSQNRTKDGKWKSPLPWIPPGNLPCRREEESYRHQRHWERDAEQQEEELATVSKNLSVLLSEQESFRHFKKAHPPGQCREADVLLRTLVEVEIDCIAVCNQLTALKESIDSFAKDRRLSQPLGKQQELLLEKIAMFDNTNHSLRELLRKCSEQERKSLAWSEQRDAMKKTLADSEAQNIALMTKLANKEKEACQLAEHLDFEKDNVKTTEELSKVLEATRSHLESQLSQAEDEKTRLTAQIQRMQQSLDQQKMELQALQEELQTLRQQKEEEGERDQNTLALLTQQALQAEESSKQLTETLREKDAQLSQALSTSSDWCLRHSREAAAKIQLEEQISALKLQQTELNSQRESAEEKSRAEREELRRQLYQLSAENTSIKLDHHRLQSELTSCEETLQGFHSDARQLKSAIRKCESLVEKYKKKVQQARLEAEEHRLKLEGAQKEAQEVRVSLEREKEQLRLKLQDQIKELEMLPERLRRTEECLLEAQQEADSHQRKNLENYSALSEVRHKVEKQGAELEAFQHRNKLLHEENKVLQEKLQNLQRELDRANVENRELSQGVLVKEASVRSLQQQLEEKARDVSVQSRHLQKTVDSAQRQVDDNLQRALAKERASQSKALNLQSQLGRAKTEMSRLQRSKEEMERRFQSQLQNMKDRLEQSDSTNRSLHNYVHFLKTSYGSVFGDSFFAS